MELTNDFRVPVPPSSAWDVLNDVERIAPCMPGAQLQEIEGEEYRGIVKVKVGPITAQYKGVARFIEQDADGHRLVLRAEGRETRGQGNANATITATLTPDGDGTKVNVVTDLTVTGKVAQFGRGVMADVSANLLKQFVQCLETKVLAGGASDAQPTPTADPAAVAEPAPLPTRALEETATETAGRVRTIDSPEPQPIDLLDTAGASVIKRAAPILAVIVVLFLVRQVLKRRTG
jgi:uncharacterized protein